MTEETVEALRQADLEPTPGMHTDRGRVVWLEGGIATVWQDGQTTTHPAQQLVVLAWHRSAGILPLRPLPGTD